MTCGNQIHDDNGLDNANDTCASAKAPVVPCCIGGGKGGGGLKPFLVC